MADGVGSYADLVEDIIQKSMESELRVNGQFWLLLQAALLEIKSQPPEQRKYGIENIDAQLTRCEGFVVSVVQERLKV